MLVHALPPQNMCEWYWVNRPTLGKIPERET